MTKIEKIIICVLGCLSLCFLSAALITLNHKRDNQSNRFLDTTAYAAIGDHPVFRGSQDSPYTLIEFGDYQCPPCRAAHKILPPILTKYKGKLRYTFRNLPLTRIHRNAMPAAIIAEAARLTGGFWPIHDSLYDSEKLDRTSIKLICNENGMKIPVNTEFASKAKSRIESDVAYSKKYGINSTPDFLLCTPDGKVIHLNSLSEIDNFVH
jgi:protein-disulfide isomerase